jgi:hypothetical protein
MVFVHTGCELVGLAVAAVLIVFVEDIGVWVARAGVGMVGMAQTLAVEAIMPLAETLLLAFGALRGVRDMINAPAVILPRHTPPRSLRSMLALMGEEKGTSSVPVVSLYTIRRS